MMAASECMPDEQLISTGVKVMLLPLRPEPEKTDAEKTSHPTLPCVTEMELQDEVIELLATPYIDVQFGKPRYHFSMIPAIKRVRELTNWDLRTSKDFVEKISKEFAGQVSARRVVLAQSKGAADERV